jgi:hypothetical protein
VAHNYNPSAQESAGRRILSLRPARLLSKIMSKKPTNKKREEI